MIIERAAEASAYRNQLLQLALVPGIKDEQADIKGPNRIRVLFRPPERVDEDDLLIDEDVRHALWRNVIDLHRKRDLLKSHHVPIRRGVLLYAPPGTGKTFACRYRCWKLPETTRIIVSGMPLLSTEYGLYLPGPPYSSSGALRQRHSSGEVPLSPCAIWREKRPVAEQKV